MAALPAAAAAGGVEVKQKTRPDPAVKTTDGDDDEGISWQLSVKDMIIPKLNTDEDDSPLTMLRFIKDIKPYLNRPPARVKSLLQVALVGHKERR